MFNNAVDKADGKVGVDTEQKFIPLSKESFEECFDVDRQLVKVKKFRNSLFYGGSCPEVRKEVWFFLFELYSTTSTSKKRDETGLQNQDKYHALKNVCFKKLESCGIAEDQLKCLSSFSESFDTDDKHCSAINIEQDSPDLISWAEEHASKLIDPKSVSSWLRVVNKDIRRTDMDHSFFAENHEKYFVQIRNILLTFGMLHPKIGYVQGMNDILARFLAVLQSEVDAYWCFSTYMERVKENFVEEDMLKKIKDVCEFLHGLKPELMSHFKECCVPELLFCHRWFLLSFKKEFDSEDSMRYLEMEQSQHLKIPQSPEDEHKQEGLTAQGEDVSLPDFSVIKYKLDVCFCVAVILLKKDDFLACSDPAGVFQIVCSLRPGDLSFEEVHKKAIDLFLRENVQVPCSSSSNPWSMVKSWFNKVIGKPSFRSSDQGSDTSV